MESRAIIAIFAIRQRLERLEATFEKGDLVQRLNAPEAIVTDAQFELHGQIKGLQ